VYTLVVTVFGVVAVTAAQTEQQSRAETITHAQDVRDLRVEVAQAQASALASLLDPQGGDWTTYQQVSSTIDLSLLTAAASASHPSDLEATASGIRQWRDDITVAHNQATSAASAPDATTVDTAYHTQVVAALSGDAGVTTDDQASWITVVRFALGLFATAVLVHLLAMVVMAQRTHRVINIGLAIAMLAVAGATAVLGIYDARSSQISVTDSRVATLSQAQADTWDIQSMTLMAVVAPDTSASSLAQATSLMGSLATAASTFPDLADSVSQVSSRMSDVTSAADDASRAALALDATPWQATAAAIGADIDAQRLDTATLVVSSLWYVVALASGCVVAIIATLAGVHARIKEYS